MSNVTQIAVRQGPNGTIEVQEGNRFRRYSPQDISAFVVAEFFGQDNHLHYKENGEILQQLANIPEPVLVIVDQILRRTPGVKQGLSAMILSTTPSGFNSEIAFRNLQTKLDRARLL